ncbi:hypothetical protein AVEN_115396-1 [Araneus ventricosus]|uniref:Uncharacterized protein n=1 Tax=Araneus ventricosus TaxID=182803 RepID=A0A4Y1ZYB1_ARAVE|nr:hypothetical protein AVEN_115396-1 [Araneus ventricosus]
MQDTCVPAFIRDLASIFPNGQKTVSNFMQLDRSIVRYRELPSSEGRLPWSISECTALANGFSTASYPCFQICHFITDECRRREDLN